jgi:hypothetical protein
MTDLRKVFRSPVKNTQSEPNKRKRAVPNPKKTYGTTEALPVIFPAERFYSLHAIPNAVLALLAFGRPESDMARLAIRVPIIHGEPHIVILKLAIAAERDTPAPLGILAINARSEEWISTLGTKKVLFVIRALPQLGIVQSNKALVHNGCLAMIAPWCETLRFNDRM